MLRNNPTVEGIILRNSQAGEVFYTNKEDKYITAQAIYYKRKVKTERVILISGNSTDPKASSLTKVTILEA